MFNNVIEGFKLSPPQEHLWLVQQTSKAMPVCAQCVILIEGKLDANALTSALHEVVNRQEILRTAFECLPEMDMALQVIRDGSLSMGEGIDLRRSSKKRREERIEAELKRMEAEGRRRAGVSAKLVVLGQKKHMLLVSLPALCTDGVGLKNLVKEICRSYAAILQEEPLSDETMQYSVISEWLNELLESEQAKAGRDYWRKRDPTSLTFSGLPYQSRNPAGTEIVPEVIFETLTRDSLEKVEAFIKQYGASFSEFLLACWQILLWRLSGQANVTVGMAYDGRTDDDLEQTLGLLAKYLPIQTQLEEGMKFDGVLVQVMESARDAYNWQECFAWRHIPALAEKHQPLLLPLGFEFEEWPEKIPGGGAEFSLYKKLVRFDYSVVKLRCVHRRDLLVTEFHYDAHSLSERQIRRLAGEFHSLIESLLNAPECRIAELNILSDTERESLLQLNAGDTDLPLDYIHRLFEQQAERTPDSTAMISGDYQLSYAELNAKSNRLARYLRRLGVKPGVIAAICADRSIEMVVGLLAILKAGGAYLPLDPDYPASRLTFMMEDSRANILLSQQHLAANLSGYNARVVWLDESVVASAQESEANLNGEATLDSLAYVIYTSGSTGNPKGAMLTHAGIVNCLCWMQEIYSLDAGDKFLMKTSLNFDPSVWELFWPLWVGGAVVLAETGRHYDTAYLAQLIATYEVTAAYFVPSMLRVFLDESGLEACRSLRYVICGGESLSSKTADRFFDKLQAEFHHSYGPTETSIAATEWTCQRESKDEIIPIGKPLGNTQIYILDAMMQLAPLGVPGELYIGGVCVGRGYLNRAELTSEKYVPNPFSRQAGERMYRTGDLARWREDDGLEFLGRIDHQVKIRGYRIELGEIEAALNSHNRVRQSVVVLGEDERGYKRLAGYVVGEDGALSAELKRHVRERLPEYMVPEVIQVLKEMPLSANGKVDRKRLPSVKDADRQAAQRYVGVRTPIEEMLGGIFEEVLKLDQVGLGDNFFELGGHSLLATQVVSRVRSVFGVEISVRSIFEEATVEGLAQQIEGAMRLGEKVNAPPLVRVKREGQGGARLPLSFAQQRLWFIEQLDPGNIVYNCPGVVRLEGRLDLDVLERVINEIIRRHEVLRTRFEVVAGEPVQVIDPWQPRRLERIDLRSSTREEREAEARRIARKEAEAGFDLSRGPLLRVKVLELGEEEHVLLYTLHHIVSDGWSMGVLVREVGALYEAYSAGKPSPLEELDIQYADYAVWQREYLAGGVLEREVAYWKEQLQDAAVLELPTDHVRPAAPSHRGGRERVEIGKQLSEGLRRLSQQEGATLFMVLMAAFKVVLMRYSGLEDVVVGTVIANRTRKEVEGLIGFFVNTLVMRTDLSGNPTFRELISREREVVLGAYVHQEVPFEKLVEEINPQRDLSRSPLFQVMMMLQNTRGEKLGVSRLKMSGMEEETGVAKFDLTLNLVEGKEGIVGVLEYSRDLYEGETIGRIAKHYQSVVEEVVRDAEQPIRQIELMRGEEKRQIVEDWGWRKIEYEGEHCIHRLFEEQVERSPEAVAVVTEVEQISYRELNRRANQLGHYLKGLGVEPEVMVGVSLERSIEAVIALLGVWKAGGVYLPLDPNYPPQRLGMMMRDAGVEVVVSGGAAGRRPQTDEIRGVDLRGERVEIGKCPEWNPRSGVEGENLAYVIYTSGSAGEPKGVMVRHRSLSVVARVSEWSFGFEAEDEMLCLASFSFDISLFELMNPLLVGGKVNLLSREQVLDLNRLLEEMKRVTAIHAVPSLMREIVEGVKRDRAWRECYGNIEKVFVGGELVGEELLEELRETFKGARIEVLYGPTEGTIICSSERVEGEERRGKNLIGRPLEHVGMRICEENSELVPVGVRGELRIGGEGVARGYLRRPELTAERFIPDGYSQEPGARVYRTGDLGRYEGDGKIEFLGRSDDQVKVRGYRIELGEIEARLAEHSAIKEAVVLVREDQPGYKRLVAYLVTRQQSGMAIDGTNGWADRTHNQQTEQGNHTGLFVQSVRNHLSECLPEYMTPSVFVVMEKLPLTPSGKIDRLALPAPERRHTQPEQGYLAPRTPVEEVLAGIWAEVLKLDRVGIHDNFFELGGDSILSIQIISRANEAGLGLTLKQLFQNQSVAELAAVAGQSGTIDSGQEEVIGEVPLTPIQEQFFEAHIREPEHFNQAVMLEATEELDLEALRAVIRQVVKQHDVLRHRFQKTESGWRQVCEELNGTVTLEEVDISGIDESLERGAIEEAAGKYQRGMNLTEGPLMRVVVFGGKGRRQRVLMVIHHLLIDGVSWRILLGDLERGYKQARRGEEIKLDAKTTSYKRWAEGLKEEAQSERAKEEANYWLALEGKRVKGLPVDEDGANTVASRRSVVTSLSEEETTGLLQEVAKVYKTQINEVLLGAVARSISEWSGEQTVLLEMEGHGREEIVKEVDLTRTVGWFTTLYPVMVEVKGGSSVELLRNAKEQIREAGRRGIYYGMLKYLSEESDLRERLRAFSQPEIRFNYLGQLDLILREGSLFRGARASAGEMQSPQEERRQLIEINGSVSGGRLHLSWTYSQNLHRRETIESVAERAMEVLREVVAGSRSRNERPYTPSDFPLTTLDQRKLDQLMGASQYLEDIYALSPLQKAMLFHSLSGLNPQALFLQLTCNLQGRVNLSAFKKAWQCLVEHNPILRTAFEWEELADPVQVVYRRVEMPIDYLDWKAIERDEQERRFEVLLEADRWRGFDLSNPPLMRLTLIQLGDDLYRLIWSQHHLLLDGWSSMLVLQDVFAFYEAYQAGKEPVMEERAPYREYIAWLKRQDEGKAEAFWRGRLKGFNRPTRLWIDRGTEKLTSREEGYEDRRVTVSEEETMRLQAFARQHRLTINTVLQAAWGLLLGRYSGEEDLIFGTTVSGRPVDLPGSESIVGPFINTLPVRMKIAFRSSVASWLSAVQSEQIEYSQYAYSSLVEQYAELPLGMPLYESILIFENYPVAQSTRKQERRLEVGDVRAPVRTKYPLTVVSAPIAELPLSIAYDLRRFDGADIDRLLAHFRNLVEGIAHNPEQPVWSLSLWSRTEQSQLLAGWKGANRVDADDSYALHRFEAQAEVSPDAIAVVFEQEQISYRELNTRTNRLAAYLQTRGVGPEVGVGIYLEQSAALPVGVLGTLKAGGTCLTLEPAEQAGCLRSTGVLQSIGASILLTQQSLVGSDLEVASEIIRLDTDWEMIGDGSGTNPHSRMRGENLAFITYTSGSTAKPKQVMITYRGMDNYLLGIQETIGPGKEDRMLGWHRGSFDVSALNLIWPLLAGARLVMAGPEACDHGDGLLDLIAGQKITTAVFTPSMFSLLLREGGLGNCSSLRRIILSGETVYPQIRERTFARLNVDLYNIYSVTEASGAITTQVCRPQLGGEIMPVGPPLPNTRLYLLDSHLQPVPAGVAGEVWVSGEGLARGYPDGPDFTAERFIPNPFPVESGERMFRTKDLARHMPEGQIEILTRSEDQINLEFGSIEPAMIEGALMEYPGIDQAALVVAGDAIGGTRLTACLGCNNANVPSAESLRGFLKERFPAQMVPSVFVVMNTLPLTFNDRIDRKALVGMKPKAADAGLGVAQKGTPYEEMLCAIWAGLFGVDEVSGKENFFEMGGHSLLATQLVSRVRDVFQVEIPLRSIFEEPTIEGLARQIEEAMRGGEKEEAPTLVKAPREGQRGAGLPLSFAQQRWWFLDQLVPNKPSYNYPALVKLEGRLDLMALERVINEIVRRHEVLRTRIEMEAGEPLQVIDEWVPRRLAIEDLTGVPREEREAEVDRITREEVGTGFDLSRGPVVRVRVLKLEEEEHVVLFTMHRIVSDGWSMGILIREMRSLYQAYHTGEESPLPELGIQYADYAYWQRRYLTDAVLEKHLTYWKRALDGHPPPLDLPADHPRPPVSGYRAGAKSFSLPAELSRPLRDLSRREGVTRLMVLLAAFKTLLYRYTAQEDIIVGTAMTNRNQVAIEPLIGVFVNMLPIRTNLGGNPRFRELLRRVKDVALGGYAHQDLPFEKLVEEIQPESAASAMPLFNVAFGMQTAREEDLRLNSIKIQPMPAEQDMARFDLAMWVTEDSEGMQARWTYNRDLFEEESVVRMHRHFETLLFNIVGRPEARLTELKISSKIDTRQSHQEPANQGDSDLRKLMSIKRKGINLPTEAI